VIKVSDRLIDLGPEGGDEGGRVIAHGTPEAVAAEPGSYTGQFLSDILTVKAKRGRRPPARPKVAATSRNGSSGNGTSRAAAAKKAASANGGAQKPRRPRTARAAR
jgi:excinuclease ABC subunit A